MPLMVPVRSAFDTTESNVTTTSSAGTTLTASGTAHTKGSWSQLIASTASPSYGILISLEGTNVAATNTSLSVDIGFGTTVFIADLLAGYVLAEVVSNVGMTYFFPVYIPSGTQIQGRCQANTVSDTVNCKVFLFQRRMGLGNWIGSRVTTYGFNSGTTRGVAVTLGNNAYGTAAQIDASTANPIGYAQIGTQGNADTTLSDSREMYRIMLGTTTTLIDSLVGNSEAAEATLATTANITLSRTAFYLPSGQDLRVAAMLNGSTNNVRDVCIYGVD